MRSWKRLTRANRRMQKRFWLISIYAQGSLRKIYQRHRKDNRASRKRYNRDMNIIRARAEGKTHYEDCFHHPCLITSIDFIDDDVSGISLIDATSPRSCSLYSCGVIFFTKEEAEERATFIKAHGWDAYYNRYNSFSLEDKP